MAKKDLILQAQLFGIKVESRDTVSILAKKIEDYEASITKNRDTSAALMKKIQAREDPSITKNTRIIKRSPKRVLTKKITKPVKQDEDSDEEIVTKPVETQKKVPIKKIAQTKPQATKPQVTKPQVAECEETKPLDVKSEDTNLSDTFTIEMLGLTGEKITFSIQSSQKITKDVYLNNFKRLERLIAYGEGDLFKNNEVVKIDESIEDLRGEIYTVDEKMKCLETQFFTDDIEKFMNLKNPSFIGYTEHTHERELSEDSTRDIEMLFNCGKKYYELRIYLTIPKFFGTSRQRNPISLSTHFHEEKQIKAEIRSTLEGFYKNNTKGKIVFEGYDKKANVFIDTTATNLRDFITLPDFCTRNE